MAKLKFGFFATWRKNCLAKKKMAISPMALNHKSENQESHLNIHVQSVHGKQKSHKCSICDYSCSLIGSLRIHFESVHEEKKPHICSICDYRFSQKGQMKRHVESVHKNQTKY